MGLLAEMYPKLALVPTDYIEYVAPYLRISAGVTTQA